MRNLSNWSLSSNLDKLSLPGGVSGLGVSPVPLIVSAASINVLAFPVYSFLDLSVILPHPGIAYSAVPTPQLAVCLVENAPLSLLALAFV